MSDEFIDKKIFYYLPTRYTSMNYGTELARKEKLLTINEHDQTL